MHCVLADLAAAMSCPTRQLGSRPAGGRPPLQLWQMQPWPHNRRPAGATPGAAHTRLHIGD